MKISTAIITLNEEKNIKKAIESVAWTDEIVVVDSGSKDRTVEIAESLGARVIHQDWLGFGMQKQFAVDRCQHDWILSIDADEYVTKELRSEIKAIDGDSKKNRSVGYLIPRLTEYMGRPIKHSGWYPDHQLRFFERKHGHWKQMVIHEAVEMNPGSSVSRLSGHIGHKTVENFAEHQKMIKERYGPLGAEQMKIDGRTVSPVSIVLAGPLTFIRVYFLKLGILDRLPGFYIALMAGYSAYLKRKLRYESQRALEE